MIVAYDTETTGLWKGGLSVRHEAQPKLCSLSALLIEETSDNTFEVKEELNVLVKPAGWVIAPPRLPDYGGLTLVEARSKKLQLNASDIHGITHERAEEEGVDLVEALRAFNGLCVQADTLLGHNESYDNNIILHGLSLVGRTIECFPNMKRVCTMMMAKDYCRLPPNFPGGDFKWPKLEEAYRHLFEREMVNAHNSLADIRQSVEVYQELKRRGVPDAAPAQERKGMKLKDWTELGWSRDRLSKLIALRNQKDSTFLNDWERGFLLNVHDRITKFGDDVFISEKQIDIFRKIEEKAP